MDGTRRRRTRDQVRQAWYARHRQRRFARMLGFVKPDAETEVVLVRQESRAGAA